MQILIIGAGAIGGNLAAALSQSGHEVAVADIRGPEAVGADALQAGATAVELDVQAAAGRDAVILAVPFGRQPEVADLLSAAPAETLVIDTANYYPALNGSIPAVEGGQVESVWTQERLGRPVVKAWNAALAATQQHGRSPRGTDDRIAIPVAADAPDARQAVMRLVDDSGFDAVDAGTLADSWRQQPGTPAYCTELVADDLREALARADRSTAAITRDRLMAHFAAFDAWPSHDEVVATNRAAHEPGFFSSGPSDGS